MTDVAVPLCDCDATARCRLLIVTRGGFCDTGRRHPTANLYDMPSTYALLHDNCLLPKKHAPVCISIEIYYLSMNISRRNALQIIIIILAYDDLYFCCIISLQPRSAVPGLPRCD